MLLDTPARKNLRPLFFLVIVAVILTIWQRVAWNQNRISAPEQVCQALGHPVMSAVTKANQIVHETALSLFRARALATENRRLRQERDKLRDDNLRLAEYFRENKAFRDKLGFELDMPVEGTPARIIARSSDRQRCRVTIQVPKNREISKGDIVREAAGLVGRVIDVRGRVAQVLLIVDAQHGLGARNQRSGEVGIVKPVAQWTSGWPDRLRMEKLRRHADVRIGDVIITSGEDGIYPAAIAVGVVEGVSTSPIHTQIVVATIRPFVDFDGLEYVWVVSVL